MNINFFLLFFFILIINFFIFKYKIFLTSLLNVFDIPDQNRKIHKNAIPVIGGFIIFFNIFIILLIDFFFTQFFINNILSKFEFIFFLLIFLSFFLLGLYDDKKDISFITKFIASFVFIFIFIHANEGFVVENLKFNTLNLSVSLKALAFPLTLLSILLFQNAVNMFDGSNLQVTNFFILSILFLYIKSNYNLFFLIILVPLFFYWYLNYKNYSFLGDGGTLSISFFLSILFIKFYKTNFIIFCDDVIVLMLLPGLDMLRLFFIRILNNKNPFLPDNNHIHHLLLLLIKNNIYVQFIITMLILLTIGIYFFFSNLLISIFFVIFFYFLLFTFHKNKN